MRKIKSFGALPFLLTTILFVTANLFAHQVHAQNIIAKPNPATLVTDAAGVLSAEQKQALENKLVAIDDSSSNQIAVVIIPSLDGYPKEEYATKLFREWGIGNKKTNNGILLLIAINDRQIRIEVGYGLEGAIPDITALNIIDNDIKPAFKAGNYYEGIDQATDNIAKAAVGEYKVKKAKKSKGKGSGGLFILILVIIFIVLRGGRGGGSNIGGGGFSDVATGMLLGSLLGGGNRHGGGGWGDSGGGGGFGGFGGGSSGGGGAGGSW
ncbi:MAG: TPM domain-containing protein [Sediminibacterium sp.]|nr:TPM domain-containing protein [Sediminibacterium sp.]